VPLVKQQRKIEFDVNPLDWSTGVSVNSPCGAEMLPDRELEKTIIYKCKQCGLSDTRLKDTK
jgi:hypothetical protein